MDLWTLLMGNIPSLLCLIVGAALVIVEMMMPGFGIPGISGIILLVAGIATTGGTIAQMLALAGLVLAVLLIAMPFCLRAIAKGKLEKTRIVLDAVSLEGRDNPKGDKLTGREGVAQTMLRPAGIVLVGNDKLNVVTSGDFIPEGARVRIERVEGNRIVVARIDGDAPKSRG